MPSFSAPLHSKTPCKSCLHPLSPMSLVVFFLDLALVGLSSPPTAEAASAEVTNGPHTTRPASNQPSALILLDLTQQQLTQLITFFSLKLKLHWAPRIANPPGFLLARWTFLLRLLYQFFFLCQVYPSWRAPGLWSASNLPFLSIPPVAKVKNQGIKYP